MSDSLRLYGLQWLDSITDSKDMSKLREIVKDQWHAAKALIAPLDLLLNFLG